MSAFMIGLGRLDTDSGRWEIEFLAGPPNKIMFCTPNHL